VKERVRPLPLQTSPPIEPTNDVAPPEEPPPEEPRSRAAPLVRSPSPSIRANDPHELFARANLLRRQGHDAEAATLYQRLIGEHAGAREAAPARLALGKLLRPREPARALAQFRALAEQHGALRAEALWGMAETAKSLGQREVEGRALEDLVSEFPDSPYAAAARARIADDTP
jgi:hypothetical protein